MHKFIHQHRQAVIGSLSRFDRLIFRGTLRGLEHVRGMLGYLSLWNVLLKHFAAFVDDVTSRVKDASLAVARRAGRPVQHLPSPDVRKEDVARAIAERDGIQRGLICVLSAVEPCVTYSVRPNHRTRLLDLVRVTRKCLHLYHYLIHPRFGFMHVRLQTWFPFALQIWINGREWLSRTLDHYRIPYQRRGNCFPWMQNLDEAQRLFDRQLHLDWKHHLRPIARQVNPFYPDLLGFFPSDYYWSVHESEWATDVMFRRSSDLDRLYPHLLHHALVSFGSSNVLRFLGRPVPETGLPGRVRNDVTTDLGRRFEGFRLKHRVGRNSIKLYDKQGTILRAETTINHPRDFKVFRPKEGDPEGPRELRPLRRGVADLYRTAQVAQGANERYLDAFASADTRTRLGEITDRLCRPATYRGRRVRALQPLAPADLLLLQSVRHGDFLLHGFRNRDLRPLLFPGRANAQDARKQAAATTRKIRLLRAHGLVVKLPHSNRYRVTPKGRLLITSLFTARDTPTDELAKLAA